MCLLLFRNDESSSCFPTSTNSSFPIALPGPSDFEEFNALQSISRPEASDLGLNSMFTSDADLSDSTAEVGVCGLRNLGNTCFMSAGLQALLSTESIVRYFIGFDMDGSEDTMIGQFSDLVKRYWQEQYCIINPNEFKHVLGKRYAQFRDCSQHDCQEFLALLLDSLNDELLMHIAKHSKITTPRKTRKSSKPKKLSQDVDDLFISSSDYEFAPLCDILTEDLSENEDFVEKKVNNSDTDSFLSPIDTSLCELDSPKNKVYVNDLLNGKREICCDSSSDSKLMDLKRVKLDDAIISKTELVEADSVGSSVVEKRILQDSIINRIFQGRYDSTVRLTLCQNKNKLFFC